MSIYAFKGLEAMAVAYYIHAKGETTGELSPPKGK